MGIVCAAVLIDRPTAYRLMPLFFPGSEFRFERSLLAFGQFVNEAFQRSSRQKLGVLREVSLYDLFHMKLAHLYGISRKGLEQRLFSVYDDAIYDVSAFFHTLYGILIILDGLTLYKCNIQRKAGGVVESQQNTEITTSVGRVKVEETTAAQGRVHPFQPDVMEPALDCRHAYPKTLRQLLDRLLILLIGLPKIIFTHLAYSTELITAITATIQLYSLAYTILDRVCTATHLTSHFEHANLVF